MKKLFVLPLSILCLASCSNDILLENSEQTQRVEVAKMMTNDFVIQNGAIHFCSVDAFFKQIDVLANMPKEEFELWESQNNFTSYKSYTNRLIDEALNIEDDELKSNFILNHANYIKQQGDMVVPVISANIYRSIVNKDGFFYVNGTKNIVDESTVSAYSNVARKIERASYVFNEIQDSRAISNVQYERRQKDYDGRRVITSSRVIQVSAFNDQFTRYAWGIEIFIDGMKKGPAKWKHYSTDHFHRNISCTFEKLPIGVDQYDNVIYQQQVNPWVFNEVRNSGDCPNWTVSYTVSTPLSKMVPLEGVKELTYDAYTRGTGDSNHGVLQYKVVNGITQ